MGDELVAGAAQLVGMTVAGELKRVGDRVAVDSWDRGSAVGAVLAGRVELLDDGEEVAEQLVLGYVLSSRLRYRKASS
ncbi:MAG TPA: hypothetical protein VGB06_00195 [Solirubrobacterales bacterium]|jgi:hypothetical protein